MHIRLEIMGDSTDTAMQDLLKALGQIQYPVRAEAPDVSDNRPVPDDKPKTNVEDPKVLEYRAQLQEAIKEEAQQIVPPKSPEASKTKAKTKEKKNGTDNAGDVAGTVVANPVPEASDTGADAGADAGGVPAVTAAPEAPAEDKEVTEAELIAKAKSLIMKGEDSRKKVETAVRTFDGGKYNRISDVKDAADRKAIMALLEEVK